MEDMAIIKEIFANTHTFGALSVPTSFILCAVEGVVVWAKIRFITIFLSEAVL